MLEGVPILMKSVDSLNSSGYRNASGTRDLRITSNYFGEICDRAVAAAKEVHDLLFAKVSPVYPFDRFCGGEAANGRVCIFFFKTGVIHERHRTNLLHQKSAKSNNYNNKKKREANDPKTVNVMISRQ